jgi:hypothetical protein
VVPSHCWAWSQSRTSGLGATGRVLTLLFLLRHGTQALEMHLRFLPASWAPSSCFPRRVFLGGAAGPAGVLVVSMGVRRAGWGGGAVSLAWWV